MPDQFSTQLPAEIQQFVDYKPELLTPTDVVGGQQPQTQPMFQQPSIQAQQSDVLDTSLTIPNSPMQFMKQDRNNQSVSQPQETLLYNNQQPTQGNELNLQNMNMQNFGKPAEQRVPNPPIGNVIQNKQQETQNQVPQQPVTSLKDLPRITQNFGNRSSVEKYSGGVNLGADFATPVGTGLFTPKQGTWVVETASSGFNQGSGNFVRIKNTDTGETLGFEHLSVINVKPGQKLEPGQMVAKSGNSGNSTGPHSSIPYRDKNGQYHDVVKSQYIRDIFGV